MSDKLNIDELVKAKLETFSAEPSPHVWDNIKGQITERKRKRRKTIFIWSLSAAVIALAFMAGWHFSDKKNIKLAVSEKQENEHIVSNKNTKGNNDAFVATETKQRYDNFSESEQEKLSTINNNKFSERSSLTTTKTKDFSKEQNNQSHKQTVVTLLKRVEFFFDIESPEIQLAQTTTREKNNDITDYDRILIAENIQKLNNKKTSKGHNKWGVGAQITPAYSSHSTNYSQTYASAVKSSSSKGGVNLGGGLSVQYKMNKKISVESGIFYSQDGKSNNGIFNSSSGDNNYYTTSPNTDNYYTDAEEMTETTINSVAGVINVDDASELKTLAITGSSENNILRASYDDDNMSQVFGFIEVPLYLRYKLTDNKFGINILGGLNTSVLVSNNVYYDNGSNITNIGSTADIATYNLSATVGAGFSYALNKHLSLAIEPRVTYYLNSINKNPDISYRPYRIGMTTGVYYEF